MINKQYYITSTYYRTNKAAIKFHECPNLSNVLLLPFDSARIIHNNEKNITTRFTYRINKRTTKNPKNNRIDRDILHEIRLLYSFDACSSFLYYRQKKIEDPCCDKTDIVSVCLYEVCELILHKTYCF